MTSINNKKHPQVLKNRGIQTLANRLQPQFIKHTLTNTMTTTKAKQHLSMNLTQYSLTQLSSLTKSVIFTGVMALAVVATGCQQQPNADTPSDKQVENNATHNASHATDNQDSVEPSQEEDTGFVSTRNQAIEIDWKRIDSGVAAVDQKDFHYPFAIDSQPVQAQVDFSHITPQQAQYSLTVGMTSNEALDKILDQLGDSYIAHEFSEKEGKLIIYTSKNVKPSSYDYVIADEFARGLVLPIEITSRTPPATPEPVAQ